MTDHSPIRTLAKTSLRVNVFLVVCVLLIIVLTLTSYWSLQRLVDEEGDIVNFHFLRLIGNLHSHEDFLTQVARRTDEETGKRDQAVIPLQYKLLERSPRITLYEGREFSFSLPFNVAIRQEGGGDRFGSDNRKLLSLGVMLSNIYSSYWTTSRYPATQVFLLDMKKPVSLAVPSISALPEAFVHERDLYLRTVEKIREHILERSPNLDSSRVLWAKAGKFFGKGNGNNKSLELIAFTRVEVPDSLWIKTPDSTQVVAVSLVDLPRINEFAYALKHPIFDSLELRSPDGEVLAGRVALSGEVEGRYTYTRDGLLIRIASDDGWVGIYQVGYSTLFHYAQWHLLLLIGLLLLILVAGLFVLRWYSTRVVTPAHEAHQYVVESDAFSALIIETGQVGICVMRCSDDKVVLENRLAQEWLDDSQSVIQLSRNWRFSERKRERPLSVIKESQIEINGRFLRVGFALTRYHGEDVILCTFHDVTAHRLTEDKLEEAKRAADAANEAKTVFLATMSHEIRTPLYGAFGTLELLGLTELTLQQRDYLATIQNSSSSLLQLISNILDVSKIESGQMPLDLVEFCPLDLVEEVIRTYSAAAVGKGLQLYACVAPQVPGKVVGDAVRIRQILGNLLSNAIKFTDRGRVVLRLRCPESGCGEPVIEWQVTDTGAGISPEQQAHLFEPFYQVPGEQCTVSGTGLGLSICSRLSKLMSGHIELVSDQGLGSSFTLKLALPVVEEELPDSADIYLQPEAVLVRSPVCDLAASLCEWLVHWGAKAVAVRGEENISEDSGGLLIELFPESLPPVDWSGRRVACSSDPMSQEHAGQVVSLYALREIGRVVGLMQKGECPPFGRLLPSREPSWRKLGLRVLIAEDNILNQQLLKEQLEQLGCTVCLCLDGHEALKHWRPGLFDVLLTDVNMPIMNGYELAIRIRALDSWIPIVGVTANAMKEEGERCMAVGMNAWLVKPLSLSMLYEGLCKVCGINFSRGLAAGTDKPYGSLDLSEKTRALMFKVIGEDIKTARENIAREDCVGTIDMLHRIRGSWSVANGGELSNECWQAEQYLSEQGACREAFHSVELVLARMEYELESMSKSDGGESL